MRKFMIMALFAVVMSVSAFSSIKTEGEPFPNCRRPDCQKTFTVERGR